MLVVVVRGLAQRSATPSQPPLFRSPRPDIGERWPSRMVATAAENRVSFRHNARDFLVRPPCGVVRNVCCDARYRGGLECAGKACRRTGFSTYEHGENKR